MKNHTHKILLSSFLALFAAGCANDPSQETANQPSVVPEEDDWFNPAPGKITQVTEHKKLPLQPQTKSLIKNIWSKLQAEGFSGYDPKQLDDYLYTSETRFTPGMGVSGREYRDAKNFQLRFLDLILNQQSWNRSSYKNSKGHNIHAIKLGYVETLNGLKYNSKGKEKVLLVATDKTTPQDKLVLAEAYRQDDYAEDDSIIGVWQYKAPEIIDTDEVLSQETIDRWNKLFYDAIQEYDVFKDGFEPKKVLVGAGSRYGPLPKPTPTGIDTSKLRLGDSNGSFVGLNLPIHIQFTGSLTNNLKTNNLATVAQYAIGNMAIGVTHNYANMGNGFNSESSFKSEATAFTTYYVNNCFATLHLGGINAHTYNHQWQATTTAVTLGYEHNNDIRPFIEFNCTQLNNYTQTVGIVGLDLDLAEHAVDSYSISTKLKAAAGYNFETQSTTPHLEWQGSLNLQTGLTLNTAIQFSTADPASVSASFALEQ